MQFRAEEAAVVEKAVRLAIESVMNVLCAVNSARTHELQRLVADKEQEIRRLEERVREAEGELRMLRRWWSPSRAPEQSAGAGGAGGGTGGDPEDSAEQRECEVRVSLALMTGAASQDPPEGLEPDQTCSPKDHSVHVPVPQPLPCPPESPACPSEGPVPHAPPGSCDVPQEPACPPPPEGRAESQGPGGSRAVKQEPLFSSPVQIKQEPFCPDYEFVQQEDGTTVFLQRDMSEDVSPTVQDILGHELWQSSAAGPEDVSMSVPHPVAVLRGKSAVPRRDQSEEAMRRRRASWRAASRRYYARKMARLHTHAPGSSAPGTSAPLYPPCHPGPQSGVHLQPHSQPWSSRGYSSCELTPDPLRPLQELQRPAQDWPRPPTQSGSTLL
ncbi:splicing factor, arginine/serine-rich 19-like [Boleophthalmus pectinirostris]|uniref:splicing factor, arginine/serine-rich 19-like n=1 Tax=Boleophthalmus pectinirostris TaxID=150288 RepID=UPI002431ECAB|nr:splicing factor, arginine/serine-rich 19-like [Boleophthalmus pectinirostris]